MIKIQTIFDILTVIMLVLLQALCFNSLQLWGGATFLLSGYLIVKIPLTLDRNLVLLVCFIVGMLIDLLSMTPGLFASTFVVTAFLRPYIFSFFIARDTEYQLCSHTTVGWSCFTKVMCCMVTLFSLVLFMLQNFSIGHWDLLLIRMSGSALLTIILLLMVESFHKRKV